MSGTSSSEQTHAARPSERPAAAPPLPEAPRPSPQPEGHARKRAEVEQSTRKERENLSWQVEAKRQEQPEGQTEQFPEQLPVRQQISEHPTGKTAGFLERFLPAGVAGSVGATWSGMKGSLKNLRDSFTLENLGNTMKNVGEFFTKLLEKIRPHFAWVAGIPGIGFLIGKDNVRKLKEFFGIDEKTEKLIGEIGKRMPEGFVFAGTGSEEKALTQLEDLRKKVRTILGKKEEDYTTVDLFNDLKDKDLLAKNAEDKGGKKTLTFTGLAKSAEEFAKAKQKEAEEKAKQQPAVAAAAPAAAPAAKPS